MRKRLFESNSSILRLLSNRILNWYRRCHQWPNFVPVRIFCHFWRRFENKRRSHAGHTYIVLAQSHPLHPDTWPFDLNIFTYFFRLKYTFDFITFDDTACVFLIFTVNLRSSSNIQQADTFSIFILPPLIDVKFAPAFVGALNFIDGTIRLVKFTFSSRFSVFLFTRARVFLVISGRFPGFVWQKRHSWKISFKSFYKRFNIDLNRIKRNLFFRGKK